MGQEKYATWSTVTSILSKDIMFFHTNIGFLLSVLSLSVSFRNSGNTETLKSQVCSYSENSIAQFPREIIPHGSVQIGITEYTCSTVPSQNLASPSDFV